MGDGTEYKHLEEFQPPGYRKPVNLLEQSISCTYMDLHYCYGQMNYLDHAINNLQKERENIEMLCRDCKTANDLNKEQSAEDEPKN